MYKDSFGAKLFRDDCALIEQILGIFERFDFENKYRILATLTRG